MTGTEVTQSEGHQWPPRNSGPFIDIGGDFTSTKKYVLNPSIRSSALRKSAGSIYYFYDGGLCVPVPTDGNGLPVFPTDLQTSDNDLNQLGTTAIARVEPTNQLANLQTFLGETLKDGIPSIPGLHAIERRASALKKAGDEFLNASFGIDPLIGDVTDLSKSISHAHQVLQQYMRDSGRMVRRKYQFPDINDYSDPFPLGKATVSYAGGQTNALDDFNRRGDLTVEAVTSKRRWFSGAFTYYLPVELGEWSAGSAALADKLLGSNIDLDTIWELTPWSWAADWVTNAGDLIHNLDAFSNQGLKLRYGYIMEYSKTVATYSLSGGNGLSSENDQVHVPPISLVTETKKRRAATPFGFGLTWDGLSTFQQAIIAALGLSRH
jgi:hypothetical protein